MNTVELSIVPHNASHFEGMCSPSLCPFVQHILREKDKEIFSFIDEIKQLNTKIAELTAENDRLKFVLGKRNHTIFGRSTEKSPENSSARAAGTEDNEGDIAKRRGAQPGHKGHGRTIPDLPEKEEIHEIPEGSICCPICGKSFAGVDLTEDSYEIDYEMRYVRVKHIRKRAMRICDCPGPKFITAPKPPQIIPKGKFSNNFLAHVITMKYFFQIPLHRQLLTMKGQGLVLNEGTLVGAFKKILLILEPLYLLLVEVSRQDRHWHIDETRWMNFIKIPDKEGYRWWLWVFSSKRAVVYAIDPSRSSEVPFAHFGIDASGIISVDRYSAYQKLESLISGLIRALCWTHFRRDFVEAGESIKSLASWAHEWVEMIASVYRLNDARLAAAEVNDPTAFARAHLRLVSSLDAMAQRRDMELKDPNIHREQRKILKSAEKNWEGLCVFVEHPEVPMDNNEAERALRGAALGRKNYYGTHSIWSALFTAICMSILGTAAKHGLNPESYLLYCFDTIGDATSPEDLEQFLPWNIPEEVIKKYSMRPP